MFKKILRKTISPFCICRKCPSFPKEDKDIVYCEFGESSSEVVKKGCVCGECFVWKINKFKNYYYCEKGKDEKSRI